SAVAILAEARESGITVIDTTNEALSRMAGGEKHQGIAAVAAEKAYSTVEDIRKIAEDRGEKPLIVVCDGIEDPPQPRRGDPLRGMCRCSRSHHPRTARLRTDSRRDPRVSRSDPLHGGGQGRKHREHRRGAQKGRRVDLRGGGGRTRFL
ncbi:MAG: hypothetical protein II953_08000, partial [Clostridia bacterium]|nr:hypothetical protein [Clostridia bacterium]